jgi:hypothetical protein
MKFMLGSILLRVNNDCNNVLCSCAHAAYNNNYAKGKCPSGSYSKASYLSAKVAVNVHYVIVLTGGASNATGVPDEVCHPLRAVHEQVLADSCLMSLADARLSLSAQTA